ncbi:hypothetical protein ACHAWF_004433 [Thalassiosira exigua]
MMTSHIPLCLLSILLARDPTKTTAFTFAPRPRSSPSHASKATPPGALLARPGGDDATSVSESGASQTASLRRGRRAPERPGEVRAGTVHSAVGRRRFASSVATATFASVLAAASTSGPRSAGADEPANLYYKSKADGVSDPLVVFSKSLENMNVDSDSEGKDGQKSDASSFSLGDIAFPTDSSDTSPTSDTGGGLNDALREKMESQKRVIDPRTHG